VSNMAEILNARLGAPQVRRQGSDLFVGDAKLTVSVATVSPVSALIHAGINVTDEGTPVRTCSLEKLGIEPRAFGVAVLEAYIREIQSTWRARCKARPAWGR